MPLPAPTQRLVDVCIVVVDNRALIILAALGCIAVIVALIASPNFRWRFPVIGRLYGWDLQSLVLRSLGLLVEMGQPVPKALELLHEVGDLPASVRSLGERCTVAPQVWIIERRYGFWS